MTDRAWIGGPGTPRLQSRGEGGVGEEKGLPTLTGSRTAPSASLLYAEFLVILIRCNGKKVVQLKRKCDNLGCKRRRDRTRRERRVTGRQQHPDHRVADWRWAAKREPCPGPSPPCRQHSATQCAPAQDGSGQALHPHPCLYKQEVTSAEGLGTATGSLFPSLGPCSHLGSTEGSGDACPLGLVALSAEHHPHQT